MRSGSPPAAEAVHYSNAGYAWGCHTTRRSNSVVGTLRPPAHLHGSASPGLPNTTPRQANESAAMKQPWTASRCTPVATVFTFFVHTQGNPRLCCPYMIGLCLDEMQFPSATSAGGNTDYMGSSSCSIWYSVFTRRYAAPRGVVLVSGTILTAGLSLQAKLVALP